MAESVTCYHFQYIGANTLIKYVIFFNSMHRIANQNTMILIEQERIKMLYWEEVGANPGVFWGDG